MATVSALKQDIVKDTRYFSPGLGGACLCGPGHRLGAPPAAALGRGGGVSVLLSLNAAAGSGIRSRGPEAVRYVAERRAGASRFSSARTPTAR